MSQLPYKPSPRDRVAHRLATVALLIATPTYRALLRGTYIRGLEHAAHCTADRRIETDRGLARCPTCGPTGVAS